VYVMNMWLRSEWLFVTILVGSIDREKKRRNRSFVALFLSKLFGVQLAFMFEDTFVNVVFNLLPRPCIAAIAATAISAAIKPYSIAVAPRVCRSRLRSFSSMFLPPGKKIGRRNRGFAAPSFSASW